MWAAVAEASVLWRDPEVSVRYLMDWTGAEFEHLPLPCPPSWYRIRAHAAGRDIAYDGVTRTPCGERHLLQVWAEDAYRAPVDIRLDDPWKRQGVLPDRTLPPAALTARDDLSECGANDLADAVIDLPPSAQWSLAEWAVTTALVSAGLTNDPVVRAFTQQLGHERAVRPTAEFEQLLLAADRDAEAFRVALRRLDSAEQWRRLCDGPPLSRSAALQALQAMSGDEPLVVVLTALARAIEALDTNGLHGYALVDEAERLIKIWPSRWQDEARTIPSTRSTERRTSRSRPAG